MASITRAFAITALALGALTASVRPMHAQAPSQTTTDQGEPDEEVVFHRLEALDAKRLTFPKSIPTREWQTAFLGWGGDAPRPQYLGTLFRDYAKANRTNQALTIKWVEALADELVQRGDAKMFLLLAEHYVKYNQPATSIYSSFYGQPNTLGLELSRLGNVLKKSLAMLSPADQKQFQKDLGEATASYLVANIPNGSGGENPEPQRGFITAVLGYELMTSYATGDEGLAAFEAVIKNATFAAEDLQGFLTLEGVRDFMMVASGFMPKLTLEHSPLTHLFNMGLRVDKESGVALRNMFIAAIKDNKPDETLFAINQVYRLAAVQRYAGKVDTLAQQMLSPVWDDAVAAIMTPQLMGTIYLKHYTNPITYIPRSVTVARNKTLTAQQETEMQAVYTELMKQTVKKPEAFYKLVDDFANNETFRKAMAQTNTALLAQHIMPHVTHLAVIYMADAHVGSTIDSNIRMMHLMRLDATLEPKQRVTTTAFQRDMFMLARACKGYPARAYQFTKVLANANTSGWHRHITKSFIDAVRKEIAAPEGSAANETLDTILRVQTDMRAREKLLQTHTQAKPSAK